MEKTTLSRFIWKSSSMNCFQAGRHPAWCAAYPRVSASVALCRIAEGLRACGRGGEGGGRLPRAGQREARSGCCAPGGIQGTKRSVHEIT